MKSASNPVSAPIRMDPALKQQLADAAARNGLSVADMIRIALRVGLKRIAACESDIADLYAAAPAR